MLLNWDMKSEVTAVTEYTVFWLQIENINSQNILNTYYVPGTVLSTLYKLSSLIFIKAHNRRYQYYLCFIENEADDPRD